jgi:hypothetical protein
LNLLISATNCDLVITDVDVERINDFFVSRASSSGQLVLEAHSIMNVPEISFINVDLNGVSDAVLSIKSNAAGFNEIPMSFVRVLLLDGKTDELTYSLQQFIN